MEHGAGKIGRLTQSGDYEPLRGWGNPATPSDWLNAPAARFFNINQSLCGMSELIAGVQGQHARRRLFVVGQQAVGARVLRVERRMSLKMKLIWPARYILPP